MSLAGNERRARFVRNYQKNSIFVSCYKREIWLCHYSIMIHKWAKIARIRVKKSFVPRYQYTVKKGSKVSRPQPGCHYQTLLGGNNDVITELFLPRGSLVSDIPAGDGKLENLFYGVG